MSTPPIYRACALLEVKAISAGRRLIYGTASTPTEDRQGHILEPAGATFAPEIPLLLHHDKHKPVGHARLWREGNTIAFEAELPEIATPGPVKDEVDRAWTSIVHGLIRTVSVGWLPMGKDAVEVLKNGVLRFLRSEICELSLVTVPANAHATIARMNKAYATQYRAAMGLAPLPGDPGVPPSAGRMTPETATETIRTYEASLAAKQAQIDAILTTAREAGRTLEPSERESCDTLQTESDGVIDMIGRVRAREKSMLALATPVPPGANGRPAGRVPAIRVTPNVQPGGLFTRVVMASVVCNGNKLEAAQYAEQRWPDTPEVSLYLKAAVAAGTTTDAVWAAPLVGNGMTDEFIALLRPKTAIGQMMARLRKVPWNVKVPAQTGTGTYNWVGEGKPKPVTSLAFTSSILPIAKAAGIIVLSEELVRSSSPSAEETARNDMIAGISTFIDQQFLNPSVAALAGVHPASITNGVTAIPSVGPLNDIVAIATAFAAVNAPLDGLTYIMSPSNALVLSFMRDPSGALAFPSLGTSGGTINGLNVVTSAAALTNVIGVLPSLVLYNDDGGITIDVSREASLQMSDTPADPADATTVFVSLWQQNYVGLRAEWFISWLKANAHAVKYVSGATYAIPDPVGLGARTGAATVPNGVPNGKK